MKTILNVLRGAGVSRVQGTSDGGVRGLCWQSEPHLVGEVRRLLMSRPAELLWRTIRKAHVIEHSHLVQVSKPSLSNVPADLSVLICDTYQLFHLSPLCDGDRLTT